MEPIAIKKLEEHVINRIAAGEVIQRPANALKELIENSIDAKATNIQIVVKDGGLKLLQITDNGTGIRKDDFDIVCERFTTSKIEKYEDLSSIQTYGFRGEALASISHIAHLTIQSKTINQDCAYKASYLDSKLKGSPVPCAGNLGTIITIEDLFYNMSTRKQVLKNATDEFRKICTVVNKYAIHNPKISFSLKKFGDNVYVKTPANSNYLDNIRIIYGVAISKELLHFTMEDEQLKFSSFGYLSNVNFSSKKGTFILFINDRLVESDLLKKSIDQMYNTHLPKKSYSFVYLSIKIDPKNIDVNVHPTKHQVHFLYEEKIIEKITFTIETQLLKGGNSRTFYTQIKLPGINEINIEATDKNQSKVNNVYSKNLVRTNHDDQKLDQFFNTSVNTVEWQEIENVESVRRETNLTSVHRLRNVIEESCHKDLRKLISEHVFVGSIDINSSLIQFNTRLYFCNTEKLLEELFYQIILFNFQNFGVITFTHTLSLKELVLIALDLPEVKWTPEDGDKNELAEAAVKCLKKRTDLLNDYFSLTIDSNDNLVTIPLLLNKYMPELAGLPKYILKLATAVNWLEEEECFRTFARQTAKFYAHREEQNYIENSNWKWITEYIVYPAFKKLLLPPKTFINNATLIDIANLPDLYKVFERC